jgi:hypothetical protein
MIASRIRGDRNAPRPRGVGDAPRARREAAPHAEHEVAE